MKTLYFLEPGQKLNDIQPSKRKRALLMSKPEWDSFGEHLVREQRTLEEAEREKEEMEIRKLQSKEMAKTWDNTIVVSKLATMLSKTITLGYDTGRSRFTYLKTHSKLIPPRLSICLLYLTCK